MKSFIIKNNNESTLVSKFIFNKFPSLSKNVFFKALRNKDIKINDKRISKDTYLNQNDKLDIYISDTFLFNLPEKIDVIYEDSNVLIVFKPQGLLSNEEEKDKNDDNYEPTLEDLVHKQLGNFAICHRLDRNTAGLVIFMKNLSLYDEMILAFKNKCINKNYIACVSGILDKKNDILNQYILLDKKSGFSKVYSTKIKGSQNALTEYKVLRENKKLNFSILDIKIHTGKTHQIRTQLKSINHPIIGDSKYGKNDINKKFKKNKQLLIAYKYSFNFDINSNFFYLNNVNVSLDEKYINKILDIESR